MRLGRQLTFVSLLLANFILFLANFSLILANVLPFLANFVGVLPPKDGHERQFD